MSYQHLNLAERHYIEISRKKEVSHNQIAKYGKLTGKVKYLVDVCLRNDWEADTIIAKKHKGATVTLDDKKSKLRPTVPLPWKKTKCVKEAMNVLFPPIRKKPESVTHRRQ